MIRNLAADVDSFTSNAFLVEGRRTVLVDPGSGFDVVSKIESHVDDLDAVVLTHTHPDHVGNTRAVTEAFEVDSWGFDTDSQYVDHGIQDGDMIQFGDHEYEALHTPGHKNDHLCFYAPDSQVLFAGDLIFQNGGFGRTDLEEGNRDRLVESIERVSETIGDDLAELHCGHGLSITESPGEHVRLALQAARY